MIRKVVTAMAEQTAATTQVNKSVSSTRQQTTHLSRSLTEQSRALKEMTTAVENISKQIAMITRDNRENSLAAEAVATSLAQTKTRVPVNGKNGGPKTKAAAEGSKQSPAKSRSGRK
jgi:methyl-accepting chemotaxis protein